MITKKYMSQEEHSNCLAAINVHERDAFIKFYDVGHRYEITIDPADDGTKKYTSVTTWNHGHFPKFDADKVISQIFNGRKWNKTNKYWGLTATQIKDMWNKNGQSVAQAGTDMHYQIECFMNTVIPDFDETSSVTHADLLAHYEATTDKDVAVSDEWSFFLQFVKDHPDFIPYRTEWTIFDETVRVAGSIDMIYLNDDGSLSIYDWKRCKDIHPENDWNKFATNPIISHIPDTNYWHYTLQLNTYKKLLERCYGVQIRDLVLVRLHPDNVDKTYELIEVPILSREMESLFEQKLGII